ncbi:MAG TPA: hypothetical protein VGZ73_20305 [Bryobacteraceae bacterium]|jgi:hypothetical protein|nr:hypothetical protein [Bryobacteraceae bacterium]
MDAVAGVFRSSEDARHAVQELKHAGFSPEDLSLLFPGSSEEEIHSIPVSDTEQPGMGKTVGGVVGAALGMAGGFELGAVAASMVPGVGPVVAVGIAGAALLGVGGAVGGAAIGSAAESKSTEGLPADEIFFYEDALRQGRSVVVVMANGQAEASRASELLAESGAESLDAAREAWWIGLRDAEKEHYHAFGHNWEQDAVEYRAGFEAALRRPARGKTVEEAAGYLRSEYSGIWEHPAFRQGFNRGQAYQKLREKATPPHVTAGPPL